MGAYDSVYALGNWDTSASVHLDMKRTRPTPAPGIYRKLHSSIYATYVIVFNPKLKPSCQAFKSIHWVSGPYVLRTYTLVLRTQTACPLHLHMMMSLGERARSRFDSGFVLSHTGIGANHYAVSMVIPKARYENGKNDNVGYQRTYTNYSTASSVQHSRKP